MTLAIVNIIKMVILALSILPFFLELLAFAGALRYKSHAINIGKTSNEFFRAIKLRYTNSAKLDISVRSSQSFIEKILLDKNGPLKKLITLDHFCLLLVSFNLACMTVFAINEDTDFTYIIAILSLCFYLFRQACAIEQKSHLIISLVEDYLENTLSHRINPARKEDKKQNMYRNIDMQADNENSTPEMPSKSPQIDTLPQKDNSDIIEAVLQEFLA